MSSTDNTPAAGAGVSVNLTGVESPYLAQYLGLWSMVPHVLEEAAARVASMDLRVHVEQQRARAEAERKSAGDPSPSPTMYGYSVTPGGVAIVDAVGTLMKAESSLGDSTSTVMLRRTIRDVRQQFRAGKVKALMARVDSPGGTTDGTEELSGELAKAAAEMPVAGFADGLAASAAYWFLSQATTISAGPTAMVGSIGTYAAIRDSSAYHAQMGVKVHVVKSAEAKGAGVPGTEITGKQLAEWQRMIDASQAVFTAAVAAGRRVPLAKAQEWADARVHVGADAQAIGLVDHVESFDAAVARLEALVAKGGGGAKRGAEQRSEQTNDSTAEAAADVPPAAVANSNTGGEQLPGKGADMGQTDTQTAAPAEQPKAATVKELKAACEGAPDSFILAQAEAGATVQQAKDAFIGFQAGQIRSRDEELGKLKAATTTTAAATTEKKDDAGEKKPKAGVKPIEGKAAEQQADAGGGADAVAVFEQRVKALVDTGVSRQKAAVQVFAADEQLRQDYMTAKNGK